MTDPHAKKRLMSAGFKPDVDLSGLSEEMLNALADAADTEREYANGNPLDDVLRYSAARARGMADIVLAFDDAEEAGATVAVEFLRKMLVDHAPQLRDAADDLDIHLTRRAGETS